METVIESRDAISGALGLRGWCSAINTNSQICVCAGARVAAQPNIHHCQLRSQLLHCGIGHKLERLGEHSFMATNVCLI